MSNEEIEKQIKLMTEYAQMMLDRADYHGLWDAAIDLQRLSDKLEVSQNTIKKQPESCGHLNINGKPMCECKVPERITHCLDCCSINTHVYCNNCDRTGH